jgi:chromosome segregation ATPase
MKCANPRRLVAFLICLGGVQLGSAQVERSGGGANAQLAMQYQQVVAERTQLQEDNGQLKKNVDDLKKQLDDAKRQLLTAKAGVSQSQAALTAAQAASASSAKSLQDEKNRMQELVDRFRATAGTLRDVESNRTQLQQQLSLSRTALNQCAERNLSLFQVTDQILDRYEHQGMVSYLERAEPSTRLKKTQIENLVLEDRQRVADLQVKKVDAATPSAASSAPAATPASGRADGR